VGINKEKVSYGIYKRDLIYNTLGSFSHLDTLFGSCIESENSFFSKEENIDKNILEKLIASNHIQKIKDHYDISRFFQYTIREFQEKNIEASIFFVQKNEHLNVQKKNFETSDYRSYLSGRIVLNSKQVKPVYRDFDCGLGINNSLDEDLLISNFKNATDELALKVMNSTKSKSIDMNKLSTVVFAPGTAGFLIHEVLGHLLEADIISREMSVFGNKIKLGDKVSIQEFTVTDTVAGYENYIGLNKIDDEGTELNSINLIKEGILSGYICDRATAEILEFRDYTGNARRDHYKRKSLPRMRATVIKENPIGLIHEKHIKSVENGILVNNIMSGNVSPANGLFYLYCDSGAMIRNGEVTGDIHDFFLSGFIHDSLMNIRNIGSDFKFFPTFCVKDGQQVPVCIGSPSVIIDNLNVGALTYGM